MSILSNDTEFSAKIIDDSNADGFLVFNEQEIAFYPMFKHVDETHIPYDIINQINLYEESSVHERFTFTRLFFLRIFALAFPKRSGSVATSVTVNTTEGTVSFLIEKTATSLVWQKITPYLDSRDIPVQRS